MENLNWFLYEILELGNCLNPKWFRMLCPITGSIYTQRKGSDV